MDTGKSCSFGGQIIYSVANFAIEIAKQNLKSDKQLKKYFTPTEANWGPKARATGKKEKNPASQK